MVRRMLWASRRVVTSAQEQRSLRKTWCLNGLEVWAGLDKEMKGRGERREGHCGEMKWCEQRRGGGGLTEEPASEQQIHLAGAEGSGKHWQEMSL